jgi:hypothetical protein
MKGFRDDETVRGKAFGDGIFNAAGVDVHDGYEGAAGLAGHCCDEETDSTGADYEGG